MKKFLLTTLSALTLSLAGPAAAQHDHGNHGNHGTDPGAGTATPNPDPDPSHGTGMHVVFDGFYCVDSDLLDADGNPILDGHGHPIELPQANYNSFKAGYTIGYQAILDAWYSTSMDISTMDTFLQKALSIVASQQDLGMGGLDPNEPFDQQLGCRFAGLTDGAADAVLDIVTETVFNCIADGDYFASFAAGLYCELSQLSNGMTLTGLLAREPHGPNELCAPAYEAACYDAFEREARAYTSDHVDNCSVWIDGPKADVFEEKRHNYCIYEAAHY